MSFCGNIAISSVYNCSRKNCCGIQRGEQRLERSLQRLTSSHHTTEMGFVLTGMGFVSTPQNKHAAIYGVLRHLQVLACVLASVNPASKIKTILATAVHKAPIPSLPLKLFIGGRHMLYGTALARTKRYGNKIVRCPGTHGVAGKLGLLRACRLRILDATITSAKIDDVSVATSIDQHRPAFPRQEISLFWLDVADIHAQAGHTWHLAIARHDGRNKNVNDTCESKIHHHLCGHTQFKTTRCIFRARWLYLRFVHGTIELLEYPPSLRY